MACIKAFLHSGLNSMLWIYLLCPLVSCAIFLEAGPKNMYVVEGDEVSLICDLNNDNDNTIFWTYLIGPANRRFISSNDYIFTFSVYGLDPENYKVIIDQSQQTYKLVIMTINLYTEAGIYECGYEKGSGGIYTPLASAMITVTPISEYVNCHQFALSSLGSEVNQEFEVACFWTHSQPGEADFDSSSGETIDVDLRFPGRIISRIESQDSPSIICRFMLDSVASVTINAPCIGENTPGLVRVDPFISEVTPGSNASFVCISGNENYSPEISWNVSVNGSDPLDSQDRVIENNDVLSIVNVQDDDQDMLVECQVHISEDWVVSSYASLRIVEVTTTPSRRPRGDSQSNPTTQNGIMIESRVMFPPSTRSNIEIIILIVIIFVIIICVIIIFVIIISLLRIKWKIKRKMNRKLKAVRTYLSEDSPSHILRVNQIRDLNRGDHSGKVAQRSGELSLAISADLHPYSNKIYRSDSRFSFTVSESELDLEPNCDRQTRQGSCQMETDLMEVNQKVPHLEVQSFEHYYETMRDEEKPKTCVHKRLITNSSRPDKRQQELKDTVVEQNTSNSSSSVAHWKVDPVDLHSRPLPRCPNNPITDQTLYDHLPSAGDIAKDEIHSYDEINKMPASPHIAGSSSETKGNAIQTCFAENVLHDENMDGSGVIRTSLRPSRMDAMVNSEQCDEMSLGMKAKSDDPSYLDNSYLQDIQSPVFDLTPMCRQDPK